MLSGGSLPLPTLKNIVNPLIFCTEFVTKTRLVFMFNGSFSFQHQHEVGFKLDLKV